MDYRIIFYKNSSNLKKPVLEYINSLDEKNRAKILKYIYHLKFNDGYLVEPYSRHIKDKIRELRVSFSNNHHRIFYFTYFGRRIVLLNAFLKKTNKTPVKEIDKALDNYQDFINNLNLYEQ